MLKFSPLIIVFNPTIRSGSASQDVPSPPQRHGLGSPEFSRGAGIWHGLWDRYPGHWTPGSLLTVGAEAPTSTAFGSLPPPTTGAPPRRPAHSRQE